MKKKKLALNRETLRHLQRGTDLHRVGGAAAVAVSPKEKDPVWETNEISICIYCTTPLDGCPHIA